MESDVQPTQIEIKLLIENTVFNDRLMGEHGLAIWFRYRGKEYLFDTGQGYVLAHNAQEMGIDLTRLAGVVLSHNHYDHIGGLAQLLQLHPQVKVYAHPEIFESFAGVIQNPAPVQELTQIAEGLWMTGSIPLLQVLEEDQKYVNQMQVENSLFMETEDGLVVLVGCSHAGVVHILKYIQQVTGQRIYGLIGGMHLINKRGERLEQMIAELAELEIERIYPLHCTGFQGVHQLFNMLPGRVWVPTVGDSFNLGD